MARGKKRQEEAGEPKLTPEIYYEHMEVIAAKQRAADEDVAAARTSRSALQAAYKAAKKAGINTDALGFIRGWAKLDEGARAILFRDIGVYSSWDGSGVQLDLLSAGNDAPKPSAEASARHDRIRAESDGYNSARFGGQTVDDNPKVPGTEEHQAWDDGARRGLDALAKVTPEGVTEARTSRKRRAVVDAQAGA